MIDMQRMLKDMKKIVEEMSTTVMEMERTILMASTNNWTMNATNITQIAEDLWYLIQSNMNDQALQVQKMLADELDQYKGKRNSYVEENIWEIQELNIKEGDKEEKGVVEDEEVILVKPYKVSMTTSSSSTSFITDKVENLFKYMKFIWMPSQTRLFKPPPHYQSLKSRGEQDPTFWKEVAMAFLEKKYNMDTARNGHQIHMFQGGPPHELYFIAIDNRNQVIIGSSKKIVAIHVVGELEVLVWFMRTWILEQGYCYNWYLLETTWTWAKDMTTTISYAKVVSVSTSCSRCYNLTWSLFSPHYILMYYTSWTLHGSCN